MKSKQQTKHLLRSFSSLSKNLRKIENNKEIFQLDNFLEKKKIHKFEEDRWPIFKREKEEYYLENYLKSSNIKKNSVFVVGPDGHGKSTLINNVVQKLSDMKNIIILELNFEDFFLKKNQKNNLTFDEFIQFFDDRLFNELMKVDEKYGLNIEHIFDVLNEKNNFNYSLCQIVEEDDLFTNEEIKKEHEKLKEDLFKNSSKKLFLDYVKHKNVDNSFKFALELSFDLLKKKENYTMRTGREIWEFFMSFLEFIAVQKDIQPKLIIKDIQLLDLFSKSVSLRFKEKYIQLDDSSLEEFRGPDLHDQILLRIVGIYIDPSIPMIIETSGNYYNYQFKEEFKLDVDQIEFLEVKEMDHVQIANLFLKVFTKEEFYPIYDKVGGNLEKLKDFMTIYLNINEYPKEFEKRSFPELKYAISLFLQKEKDNFLKKMTSAQLLICKYTAEEDGKEMEYEFNHEKVEFQLVDLIEKVLSSRTRGILERQYLETIDVQMSIPGSALINSDIFYYNIEKEVITFYHRSYFNLMTNFISEKFEEWGKLKYYNGQCL
eukprot:gene2041-1548_t